jgi:hypothetical protein
MFGSGTAAGLPRQTSLQTPVTSNGTPSDRPPDYLYPELPPISSPPPPYEVAMGKVRITILHCTGQKLGAQKANGYDVVRLFPLALTPHFLNAFRGQRINDSHRGKVQDTTKNIRKVENLHKLAFSLKGILLK